MQKCVIEEPRKCDLAAVLNETCFLGNLKQTTSKINVPVMKDWVYLRSCECNNFRCAP